MFTNVQIRNQEASGEPPIDDMINIIKSGAPTLSLALKLLVFHVIKSP